MAAHKAGRNVHRRHAGAGGHSQAIAEKLTSGRLISLDRDAQALGWRGSDSRSLGRK